LDTSRKIPFVISADCYCYSFPFYFLLYSCIIYFYSFYFPFGGNSNRIEQRIYYWFYMNIFNMHSFVCLSWNVTKWSASVYNPFRNLSPYIIFNWFVSPCAKGSICVLDTISYSDFIFFLWYVFYLYFVFDCSIWIGILFFLTIIYQKLFSLHYIINWMLSNGFLFLF